MEDELDFLPPQRSPLQWLFRALGVRYAFLLPVCALLAFVLAALAIAKFKTPYLTAVLLAVVPLPLVCGAVSMVDGLVASLAVLSNSGATPKVSEVAEGSSLALLSVQVGLILSLPLYGIAVVSLCLRSLIHQAESES